MLTGQWPFIYKGESTRVAPHSSLSVGKVARPNSQGSRRANRTVRAVGSNRPLPSQPCHNGAKYCSVRIIPCAENGGHLGVVCDRADPAVCRNIILDARPQDIADGPAEERTAHASYKGRIIRAEGQNLGLIKRRVDAAHTNQIVLACVRFGNPPSQGILMLFHEIEGSPPPGGACSRLRVVQRPTGLASPVGPSVRHGHPSFLRA